MVAAALLIERMRHRRPNIKRLAARADTASLVAASFYKDLLPGRNGEVFDVGAPVREDAIRALDQIDALGDDVLLRALGDHSERVVLAAIEVISCRGDTVLLGHAVASLPEGRSEGYSRAVKALFALHAPGATRHLAEALIRREDTEPLSAAESAMVPALLEAESREEARGELIEALVSALSDTQEVVRERAGELLARLAPTSVVPLVAELESGRAGEAAARVLGAIKDRQAIDPLLKALEHTDSRVRAASCHALGELRDPVAVEALMRATHDPEHTVRAHAGVALDNFGTVGVALGVSAILSPMLSDVRRAIGEAPAPPLTLTSGLHPNQAAPTNGVTNGRSHSGGLVRRALALIDRTAAAGSARAGDRSSKRSSDPTNSRRPN